MWMRNHSIFRLPETHLYWLLNTWVIALTWNPNSEKYHSDKTLFSFQSTCITSFTIPVLRHHQNLQQLSYLFNSVSFQSPPCLHTQYPNSFALSSSTLLSSFHLWLCCLKEDPFQSPRVGSYLSLRNKLSEETHTLTKQETLLGRGTWVESRRIRKPRRTSPPRGLQSWVLWSWA